MLSSPAPVQQSNTGANSSSLSGSSSSSSVEQTANAHTDHSDLKSYLIEKLLNENDTMKPIKVETYLTKDSASKEDLVSETGTYTIEEKVSDLIGIEQDKPVDKYLVNNDHIMNSIDLMSARAMIDEKFGILERPSSGSSSHVSEQTGVTSPVMNQKRQMQKIVRERNKTYSLTHDLVVHLNQQHELNIKRSVEDSTDTNGTGNSLTKATTYDVIATNEELLNSTMPAEDTSIRTAESADLDVTVTSQVSSTKSGVNTEILLGNTEQLIETIKKRRSDKKLLLQQRLETANNTIKNASKHTLSPSSSSSCSSSTSIDKDPVRSWTIPNDPENKVSLETTRENVNYQTITKTKNNSITNSSYSEDDKQSNLSDSSTQMHSQRRGNGGLAFDYMLSDENQGTGTAKPTQPQRLTSANLQRHRSATRGNSNLNSDKTQNSNRSSFSSTNKTPNSRSSHVSITRNSSRVKPYKHNDSETNTSITNVTSGFTTPKSSASLGARIQAKANYNNAEKSSLNSNYNNNSNNHNNTPRTPLRRRASDNSVQPSVTSFVNSSTSNSNNNASIASPYTNRTLFLRQQSALAKRESLDSENKKPGILKKPTTNSVNRNSTRTSSRQPSRNTSPQSSNSNNFQSHQSPLMTGSLNLPSGSSLPGSYSDQKGSFQRRKNYDPAKAVEQDRQNRLLKKQSQQNTNAYKPQRTASSSNHHLQPSASQNSIQSSHLDYDSMSDSSFSIPVQSLKANIGNKQIPTLVRKIKGRSVSVAPNSLIRQPLAPSTVTSWSRPIVSSYSDVAKTGLTKSEANQADLTIKSSPSPVSLEKSNNPDEPVLKLLPDTLEFNTEILKSYEKILQSTLQRLCIRLIQMSTGVLDKIGDENSGTESNLFNGIENSELERMQQLAKLVHSMQLVHDHIQIIDTTLFSQKPNEDNYMKELSKIRQEVEYLKQNASTSSSTVTNTTFNSN